MKNKVKLGDLVNIKTGKLDANAAVDNGKYPFFTTSEETFKIDTYAYDDEAVLVAGNGNLNIKYFYGKFNAYQRTYILTKKENINVNIKYIYYFLDKYLETLRSLSIGGVIKYIKLENLINPVLDLPTIEVQNKIVEKLDTLKKILDIYRKKINILSDFNKSLFTRMFGDIKTNDKNWKIIKLEKYINIIGGYAFKNTDFKSNGIPLIRIGNINSGNFKNTNLVFIKENLKFEKFKVFPNDILISLTGTVGKDDYGNACILRDTYPEYYLNQRNAKIILTEKIEKNFFLEIIKIKEVKKKLTGISRGIRQANISNKDIYNLSIPLPPIELQNKFAERIEKIEKLKFTIMTIILKAYKTLKKKGVEKD